MANYHIWHHPNLDGQPAFATTTLAIPTIDPTSGISGSSLETKTFQSLQNDMAQLRADGASLGIVDPTVVHVGKSTDGQELWALKVGKGAQHKVLFTGCHHAREWISVEVPFLVAKFLIDNYKTAPQNDRDRRIKHLVDNREIWFVPMVNPDGHNASVTVNRLWRPNFKEYIFDKDEVITAPRLHGGSRPILVKAGRYRGVDLNRNYPTTTWGQETFQGTRVRTSRNPHDAVSGTWAGPSPQSEVETQLMVNLMAAQSFRASITYHNFGQLFMFPGAATHDKFVQFVGKGMSSLIDARGNPYTYESGDRLYPTTGDSMEFCYETAPGRPTFTPELPPKGNAPDALAFSGLPEDKIVPTFEENLDAALALINSAGFDAPAASVKISWTPATSVAQVVRNAWKVFEGFGP